MSPLPLFAFGTLRRGESNHQYLAGTYERVLPGILRDFRRGLAAHGFPAIARCPLAHVEGELYFLRSECYAEALRLCDQLEDLPPGQLVGRYYRRMDLVIETAEGPYRAWVYADPNTV
ncbi:MAG TPA: gamma-glutamylcyclotransferase family protein [Planctomycetaceae bacterium]|nr:gamma-glutamylcyclotransferase family protein [Planctomycetaceae bacterium]